MERRVMFRLSVIFSGIAVSIGIVGAIIGLLLDVIFLVVIFFGLSIAGLMWIISLFWLRKRKTEIEAPKGGGIS
ncbi:MAG: hypothetical protein ACRDF4_01025 [Rhabdochlamydiaceae bacterium]